MRAGDANKPRKRAKKPKMRATPAPRASFEEIEIRAADGVALRAVMDDPPEGTALEATLVLGHAMFARKTEWGRRERPGLAQRLAARGFRTIAFDFRGHGDSEHPRSWSYDDFVRLDLPAVVECARARAEGRPVIVVGHSLGAHVALAAQAIGALDADGIVSIAGNVWLRALEPSRVRWAAKVALAHAMRAVTLRAGRFPARALRMGSDDEASAYMLDLLRGVFEGKWRSADGRDDYLAALGRVTIPVCSVASDGDRINCRPVCAERLVRRCGGPVEVLRVTRSDDGGPPPDHMQIVTTRRAESAIMDAVAWTSAAQGRGT
jgi:predicted alpha/beta hydrolase